MKKQIGNMLRRFKSNHRVRANRLQHLGLESLEDRKLLAADLVEVPFPYHNDLIAEDVSGDYNVSALDALLVINAVNNGGSGKLPDVAPGQKARGPMLDTSGDNNLSPIDALKVINFLNGEGETTPTARFTYQFVTTSGAPLSSNTVSVGDIFQLQTFVQDTRGFSAAGINSPYLDIDYDNGDAFDVAVGEIQSFKFFFNQLDPSQTSSSFTLTLAGQTTAPIALFTAGGSPRSDTAIAAAIQDALAGLPNVGSGNVSAIVDAAATSEDQQNGTPRFNFEIRFGNQLAGQDLPLLTLDSSNVGVVSGGTFDFAIAEVLAGDQSNPTAEAQAIIFSNLYDFARRAVVSDTQFDDIGAASQLIPLPSPAEAKLVFSIPMIAVAPGVINFTPNQADNPPATDIVTGVTVIPPSMVDYGAAFSLTVVTDPTAPVAINDTLSLEEDTQFVLNGNVTSNDTVTSPRTLSVVSAATIPGTTLGSLSGLTYTPPANFVGTDTITYVAQDSTGLTSNMATVTINITPVNDAPIAVDDSLFVDEDSTNNTLDVLANDSGGPANEAGDTLTITNVTAASNGVVSIASGGGSLVYTPNAGFIGTETFTYTMQDQGGLTDTATVTVDVEPAVLPSGRPDTTQTDENTPVTVAVLNNDRVNDNSTPVLISAADGSFGTVTVNQDGTVTYTPTDPNFYGTDSFTYVMNDTSGLGVDSTGTVTVTVLDINDPPVLVNDAASGTEDTVVTIPMSTLLSNDSPGLGENAGVAQNPQTLTLNAVSALTAGGTVAIVGSNVVYTPATDFNGAFSFSYTAVDNGTPPLSGTATVTVTVSAVNDDPIAAPDSSSTNEDTAVAIPVASLLSNDKPGPDTATDEAGQTLSVTGVSASSGNGGTVSLSGSTVNYSPAANFNGVDTFTYTLSDGAGGTATGTVTVNVAPINDAPVAGADSVIAYKEFPANIKVADLLANDSPGPANEASQTLSIVAVASTANTNGTVVLNANGTITYTPGPGYTGPASFQYTLQDSGPSGGGNVNTSTGVVNIDVQEFVPSKISGTVFIDDSRDGLMDSGERHLGSVSVTLTGVALGQVVPAQTIQTLADGSYSFENLSPGQYVVTVGNPTHFLDGNEVAGSLGDLDTIANQFTIGIAEPGGAEASSYNFALLGLEAQFLRTFDQLASRYTMTNPTLAYNGIYFGLDAANNVLWSTKLDGFDEAVFAEAVMDGGDLLLSYVDAAHVVRTAVLGRGDFIRTFDSNGNSLIRVLGDIERFNFEQVDMSTPPFDASQYLAAIDDIFEQEDW